jgi:hypothetical protein
MNSEAHSESPLKRTEEPKDAALQPVLTGFGYEPCDVIPRWITKVASQISKLMLEITLVLF